MGTQRVWRFVLAPDEDAPPNEDGALGFVCDVEMPSGATMLPGRVELTSKGLAVYALVDPDVAELTETRSFFVCGNGVDLPDAAAHVLSYRGTFKAPGSITAHVFELATAQVN